MKKNQKAGCAFFAGGCLMMCFIGVVGIVFIAIGASNVKLDSNTTSPRPAGQASPPVATDYTFEKDHSIPGIKRSLVVHLKHKVSEDRLREIAYELKSQEDRPHDRTFIVYYLPGMDTDDVCWATTHFDPDLKIGINSFMEPGTSPFANPAPEKDQ